MEYRRFGNTIVVRMDHDDDIQENVKLISEKENIKLANVSALGNTKFVTLNSYDQNVKQFFPNTFEGHYEIAHLNGTINTQGGRHYSHLHIVIGDMEGRAYAGHLSKAIVGTTLEMFIHIVDGVVDRVNSGEPGGNVLMFEE